MPPDNPLVARVAMLFRRDSRTFVNVFHVLSPIPWDISAMTALAALFADWWNDDYRVYSASQVSLTQIQVRKLDPDNPLAYDLNVSPPNPGLGGTTPDTGATTQTMSWRTGLAGRKFRGRNYAVGLMEIDVANDDSVVSPRTASLAAAAGSLLSRLIISGVQLAIFHKVDNTATAVLTTVVENLVDSQRKRLANRGA